MPCLGSVRLKQSDNPKPTCDSDLVKGLNRKGWPLRHLAAESKIQQEGGRVEKTNLQYKTKHLSKSSQVKSSQAKSNKQATTTD